MNCTKKFEKNGNISTKKLGLVPARNRLEITENGIVLYGRKLNDKKSKNLNHIFRYIIIPFLVIVAICVYTFIVVIIVRGNADQITSRNVQDVPLQVLNLIFFVFSGVVGYYLGRKILNILFTTEHILNFNISEIIEMSYDESCVTIITHKDNNNGEVKLFFSTNESDIEEYNRFVLIAEKIFNKNLPKISSKGAKAQISNSLKEKNDDS